MPFAIANFQGDQITPAVTREIVYAGADETPKLAALMALGSQITSNTTVEWYDQAQSAYITQINNAGAPYGAATTTLVVDSSAVFRPGDILIADATGERMQVASITNATTIVVVRGVGGTTAAIASVADDAVLRSISAAFGEGSPKADPRKAIPTQRTNFCQIFKEGVEITGTAGAVITNTQDELARQRMLAMRRLSEQVERTINFGVKSNNLTIDGRPARTMGGLYQYIESTVYDPSGALNEDKINVFAKDAFETGSSVKLMFAGSVVIHQLHSIFKDRVRYEKGSTAFGIRLGLLDTAHGQFQVVHDRSLNGAYARDALVVDPSGVRMRPLTGRELQLYTGVQANGQDTVAEEWRGEFTFEWGAEKAHARIQNVADPS